MDLLIVTAVEAEARSIGRMDDALVVVAGLGRTNAAAATTEHLLEARRKAPFDAVISAGVAGALPLVDRSVHHESGAQSLAVGDTVVASSCVYAEEGIVTAGGFAGMAGLGFRLGDFEGNAVPVDEGLLERLAASFTIGPIATVATCSGTNAAATEVARRTGALAEAMEGAAVVHAARRLNVPAIEIRAISNTTGDRVSQTWDLEAGLAALGRSIHIAAGLLRT